ncbi:MAG: alpha/beta fold hydrolase [Planctomycetaceae bacterium]
MESVQASVADNDEQFEPCPTPLSWQDVLRQFGEQSQRWSVTVNEAEVHGRTIGEGPPLVFVNGLMGDLHLQSLTVWVLKEEFRCVLFDWPSKLPQTSPAALADYVTSVANEHAGDQFSIFSTGAGCMAALHVMQRYPDRIRKAILHGAFAKCDLSFPERLAARFGSFLPGTLGWLPGVVRILQQNHRPWFPPFDQSRWSFAEANLSSTPISRLSRLSLMLKQFDFTADLESLKTPLMLVRCEGDSPLQSSAQDQLEAKLPHAEVEWLHTCGRLAFLTHPHRLKKIVKSFLEA